MAAGYAKNPLALELIQAVLGQLALPVPVAAVASVADETAQQMVRLLTWSGRRLVKPTSGHRWSALLKTWELTTVPGTTLYDLPVDWDSFEDLTAWNFTSQLPLLGPASDPQWMALKARSLGPTTISVVYRVRGGKFELYFSPSAPQLLKIDYSSRSWVQKAVPATPITYADQITDDGDTVLYDNELINAKLKLAFLQAKGFDTSVAQAEYNEIEEAAICADADATILSANVNNSYPLIGQQNLPDTGYGV